MTTQIPDLEALDEMLSRPTPGVIETLKRIEGDILILGVGGKMGPTLARMARRASDAAGSPRKIIGVSRFSDGALRDRLESWDVETMSGDLLNPQQLRTLPDVHNIVYMAGMKFGSTGREAMTWAMNSYLPGMVCQRYPDSRIAAFSTGNVYGLAPVVRGGSVETDELRPDGDYAMSCLGRERIFEHFSRELSTKVALIRLNYACELRYGVLVDLARKYGTASRSTWAWVASMSSGRATPMPWHCKRWRTPHHRRRCSTSAARRSSAFAASASSSPSSLAKPSRLKARNRRTRS